MLVLFYLFIARHFNDLFNKMRGHELVRIDFHPLTDVAMNSIIDVSRTAGSSFININ